MDHPEKRDVKLGPLARRDIRDQVHDQVKRSIEQGAKLILGGKVPERKGFFYPATLLDEVSQGMPAFDEEIFGPVISIITAEDEKQAIELANETPYGLGAAVFTQDEKRGEYIASNQLQAGVCAVNTNVTSDPRLPFGGMKHSGFGRELSQEGIQSFTNIKTVMIG
jgi:succinate-semialdehyde dehydrogenase/glutarate-semialdehyde dehydrogenase